MGLMELAFKIIICLLIAGIIGWIVGFLLGRIFGSANATELLTQSESKMRVREQELHGLRSDLMSANAKVGSLQTEVSSLAATIKTREGWINEMEAKQQELQADLDARVSELDELKIESEQETKSLKAQLAQANTTAQTEIEALKIRVAETEGAAKLARKTDSELATLRTNFAKQTDELTQATLQLKKLVALTQQVKEHEATITNLASAKQATEASRAEEIAQLQSQIGALEVAKNNAVKNQTEHETELATNQQQLALLNSQVKTKDEELARLQARVAGLEVLSGQLQAREKEVEQLTVQNNALILQSEQTRQHQTENEQLKTERVAVQAAGDQTREAEITALKVRITELEMMVREVKEPPVKVSPASTMPPSPKERDDLKKVFGIGPVLEQLLNKHGVYWFRQIADWEPDDMRHYDDLLENFHGRIARERWIESARDEHQKKYGENL